MAARRERRGVYESGRPDEAARAGAGATGRCAGRGRSPSARFRRARRWPGPRSRECRGPVRAQACASAAAVECPLVERAGAGALTERAWRPGAFCASRSAWPSSGSRPTRAQCASWSASPQAASWTRSVAAQRPPGPLSPGASGCAGAGGCGAAHRGSLRAVRRSRPHMMAQVRDRRQAGSRRGETPFKSASDATDNRLDVIAASPQSPELETRSNVLRSSCQT